VKLPGEGGAVVDGSAIIDPQGSRPSDEHLYFVLGIYVYIYVHISMHTYIPLMRGKHSFCSNNIYTYI
jgi:hypothetical protein